MADRFLTRAMPNSVAASSGRGRDVRGHVQPRGAPSRKDVPARPQWRRRRQRNGAVHERIAALVNWAKEENLPSRDGNERAQDAPGPRAQFHQAFWRRTPCPQ
jgi:hypothetical protein